MYHRVVGGLSYLIGLNKLVCVAHHHQRGYDWSMIFYIQLALAGIGLLVVGFGVFMVVRS
jgi:hypothetical protein